MFSFFTKKEMNLAAAKAFWAWFEEQEAWIVNCIGNRDSAFVWAIDERLKPVFPYFKGELEFQLGYNDGVGEFFFFHFGKKELIRDGKVFGEMMSSNIAKKTKAAASETFEQKDYTSGQMFRRPAFWMAFVSIAFLAAVGSSVISFAKDLALSVEATESLAVTLVGVLSVCNGIGRILTGAVFDALGRKKTMVCANILTICAAAMTLLAVSMGSLPLCIVGLCLTGLSYGSCPTITAAFTSSFYGMKHYSDNMALMTFNVMGGSFIATLSSKLLESAGNYTASFVMLLALTLVALVINLFIRKP